MDGFESGRCGGQVDFPTEPDEVATGQAGIGVDDDHVNTGHAKTCAIAVDHLPGANDRDAA